jgi:MFS family permease
VIAVVQLLPSALVAPLAARSADRRGPGALLLFGYVAQAVMLTVTAAALLLDVPSGVVYVGAVAAASAVTLVRPAQSALVPSLVSEPADLTAANAVSGWVESVSTLVGPALAGVMIRIDGPGAAVALFAIGLAVGAVLVAPLRQLDGPADSEPESEAPDVGGVARALRRAPAVSLLLSLVGVQYVAIGALDVLEVVLAVDVLGLGPPGAGYLGAAFGAGGVLGGVFTFALIGRRRLTGSIVAAAVVFGAAFAALGLWAVVVLVLALACVVGASHAVLDMASRTILHRVAPPSFLGRIFGVQEGLNMLGLAIGSILVAPLVHAGGAEAATVAMGGLLVAVTLAAAPMLIGIERVTPVPSEELVALRRSPLFEMLAAPVLEDLARALTPVAVAPSETVVREGERGTLFYLVADGELDVTVGDRHLRTIDPGDGFGEIALLRDGIRTATVTARGSARLYALEREPFLEAVTGSPHAHRVAQERVADQLAAG